MFCYIYEFLVVPGQEEPFKAAYGEHGPWVRLFRRDPGYVRTELRRDADNPRRFITIDHWTTRAACVAFKSGHREEFDAIDMACERYTDDERHIGDFELVG